MSDFGYGNPMTTEQLEHYRKVKRARRKQGLSVLTEKVTWDRRARPENGIMITDVQGYSHPLLGMRLRDTESGDMYVVDSVSNCWLDGFYIQLAIRNEETDSHALIFGKT